jgi:DNA-binding IclR family transcriptional regulator
MRTRNADLLLLRLLKQLRTAWLTRREIAERTGLCFGTVRKWLGLLLAEGFIVERTRAGTFKGSAPAEFSVAVAWVGGGA